MSSTSIGIWICIPNTHIKADIVMSICIPKDCSYSEVGDFD